MQENKRLPWILIGYQTFALLGPNQIKIQTLAKKINKNKSSFYHYFQDLENFIQTLLQHHLKQAQIIAHKESLAQNIQPDLIHILNEHKIDLLFNRQLRIQQDKHPNYPSTLQQANQIVGLGFIDLWAKDLQIKLPKHQLIALFELALENFYLQINPQTLNPLWLQNYFKQLKRIALNFT